MGCGASSEAEAGAPPPETEFQWDEEETNTGPPPKEEGKKRKMNKRSSVSAECMELNQKFTVKVIEKSEESKAQCRKIVDTALLMKHLDEQLKVDIVNAVREKEAKAGEVIIKQGDVVAEDFYMLVAGNTEAFVNDVKVMSYGPGGCFGELALMYTAPRAATVKAVTDCKLFALDRQTFREVVINSVAKRKETYSKFLKLVELFSSMADDELNAVADVLVPATYKKGDTIITEGEGGDVFFLLEEGTCEAIKDGHTKGYKSGEYFGELALLTEETEGKRQATVKATSDCKVAMMDRSAFKRLLGPLESILRRNAALYTQYVN
mmetsp:Transcript_12910/g.15584  ORF Transcript_12910/g.15584 Transcript_12910/m.15584 type:complete len:322 (+) Transcript_12910:260-1225(+)|eukprot:CAMPEP_0197851242 /NCGR_PEP_ID=MMETSP1438-20131217/17632_1 /TAXON_ID=1461541 /ORGANISM="Pterosperma sp., Strain CCMP1384" /LENGTH=321 /DNA_ID=CAMNT_0043464781 /DNA_START=255 /DNA_END=1220 /DNA_ORIENTATION=+